MASSSGATKPTIKRSHSQDSLPDAFWSQVADIDEDILQITPPAASQLPREDEATRGPMVQHVGQDIINTYLKSKGLQAMYPWQSECLDAYFARASPKRLVYCLPTGAGKSLVADIALLHTTLVDKRDCIMIQPYVSIVEEKSKELTDLGSSVGFKAEVFAGVRGRLPLPRNRSKPRCLICTIEKANAGTYDVDPRIPPSPAPCRKERGYTR